MSSSQETKPIINTNKSKSGLEINLHPLVIINISDHFTRTKVNNPKDKNPRCIGLLYGNQQGTKVEIRTSFDIVYTVVKGQIVIDTEYVDARLDLYKQVFEDYEVLGWYSTGNDIKEPTDSLIQKQIMKWNDSPLYLLCGVKFDKHIKDLPLFIYDTSIVVKDDVEDVVWSSNNYNIETDESERISVDHVNHLEKSNTTTTSKIVPHLSRFFNAVEMLSERTQVLLKYLKAVKSGKAKMDYQLLREIKGLANKLPALDSVAFSKDYENEFNESLLVTYLSSMTKGTVQLDELLKKYNTCYEQRLGGRGFY